jgi:hypothetical protein
MMVRCSLGVLVPRKLSRVKRKGVEWYLDHREGESLLTEWCSSS